MCVVAVVLGRKQGKLRKTWLPQQRWVTVLRCMCWEGFYERVTFEQRPRRSEDVTLRGKRFLEEETMAGTDADKRVCSV